MSNADGMKLTPAALLAGLNCGAITGRQLALFGMKGPPSKGWRKRLIGMEITEEKYREFVALRKQQKEATPQPPPDPSLAECIVYFDGGSTNNVPKRGGYGNGYGSFQLNGEVVRLDFGRPMSANEAEVRTLIAAAEAAKITCEPEKTRLCVYGDSQIALNWARKAGQKVPYRPPLGCSPGFTEAVADLYVAVQPFAEVAAEWQPRDKSVEMFGH
jgi:ribonuclease HI